MTESSFLSVSCSCN